MCMAIRSVHPKSLKDGGSEVCFLQQPHYSCGEKNPAAEKYGKVQLLTCLSHTQILSSKSITTIARPKLFLEPHDWEKFTNFLVVPQGTRLPIILPLPLWSRPRPTNKLTLLAPGRPHRTCKEGI